MKLTRAGLLELEKNLELMQSLNFHKKDKKSDYNQFKLVCGQNFKRVHKVGQAVAKQMAEMLEIRGYDDFVREATELIEKGESVEPLKEKYADVLKKHHDTNVAVDKLLESEVEVDIEKFPLEKIPVNITGSFLNSIKDMLLY